MNLENHAEMFLEPSARMDIPSSDGRVLPEGMNLFIAQEYKTVVTPLLVHWSYCSLSLRVRLHGTR